MTAPGARVRAVAARWIDPRTMERLIDPAVSDLQVEYAEACATGSVWRRVCVAAAGYIGIAKLLIACGGERALDVLAGSGDERRAMLRTFVLSLSMMLLASVLLALPPLVSLMGRLGVIAPGAAITLVAQTLPLSIPIGLVLGILIARGEASPSVRTRMMLLMQAGVFSAVSFLLLGWVVPDINQAFREGLAGRAVPRSVSELTFTELGRLLRSTEGPGRDLLSANYHLRWALAFAPLVLTGFAVVVINSARRAKWELALIGGAAILAYPVMLSLASQLRHDYAVPVSVVPWVPNLAMLTVTLAIMLRSVQTSSRMQSEDSRTNHAPEP